jgi:hypothetical protein
VLVLGATGIVLLGKQWLPAARLSMGRLLACGVSLAAGAAIVASPYMMTIGHFTNKTTGRNILQSARLDAAGASTSLLGASCLGVFGPGSRELPFVQRNLWCFGAIAEEVVKGFHYVAWLPAVAGLVWFRRKVWETPGAAVPLVVTLLHTAVLWRVAFVEGYVAERHSLTIVLCMIPWACAAIVRGGEALPGIMQRWQATRRVSGAACAAILVGILAVSGLPKCLAPLHTNRTGFHAAGIWLANHAGPQDLIVDPFSWVEYYSGQVHRQVADALPASPQNLYVVLGGTKNEHERLPLIPRAKELREHGREVYRWPSAPIKYKAEEVVVYHVPGPR